MSDFDYCSYTWDKKLSAIELVTGLHRESEGSFVLNESESERSGRSSDNRNRKFHNLNVIESKMH